MLSVMPDSHSLANGHSLEQFRIEKVLGEGGFGLTYLAVDVHLDKRVVIKENFPSHCAERLPDGSVNPRAEKEDLYRQVLKNFLKEARMLANFEHPNIVPVHGYFEANGTAYFVMPFLDGISLKDLAVERGDQGLSLGEYLALLDPLLDALDTLHRGKTGRGGMANEKMAIFHRDIKPDNILIVEEEGGEMTPVLIDFGSARDINAYHDTAEYRRTIKYKSGAFTPPEFTENDRRSIGPSSDLFGIGACVYSCIARDPLHDRSRMDDLRGDSAWVEEFGEDFLGLIMDATELSAKDRPQSTEEWREKLESARCHLERKNRDTGQNRVSLSAKKAVWPIRIALAVLALVAAAFLIAFQKNNVKDEAAPNAGIGRADASTSENLSPDESGFAATVVPKRFVAETYGVDGDGQAPNAERYFIGWFRGGLGIVGAKIHEAKAQQRNVLTIHREDLEGGIMAFKIGEGYLPDLASVIGENNKYRPVPPLFHQGGESSDDDGFISLQSASIPGAYLRHSSYQLLNGRPTEEEQQPGSRSQKIFQQDTTWRFHLVE